MIDEDPTYRLPACPVCSSAAGAERPFWRLAAHSTRARKDGGKSWICSGCKHALEVFGPGRIYYDIEVIRMVEGVWAAEAEILFEQRVAGWSPLAVDKFRRTLDDRLSTLPGATEPLALQKSTPAAVPAPPRPPKEEAKVPTPPAEPPRPAPTPGQQEFL